MTNFFFVIMHKTRNVSAIWPDLHWPIRCSRQQYMLKSHEGINY